MVSFIPPTESELTLTQSPFSLGKTGATQDEEIVKSQSNGHQWQDPNPLNLIPEPTSLNHHAEHKAQG